MIVISLCSSSSSTAASLKSHQRLWNKFIFGLCFLLLSFSTWNCTQCARNLKQPRQAMGRIHRLAEDDHLHTRNSGSAWCVCLRFSKLGVFKAFYLKMNHFHRIFSGPPSFETPSHDYHVPFNFQEAPLKPSHVHGLRPHFEVHVPGRRVWCGKTDLSLQIPKVQGIDFNSPRKTRPANVKRPKVWRWLGSASSIAAIALAWHAVPCGTRRSREASTKARPVLGHGTFQ